MPNAVLSQGSRGVIANPEIGIATGGGECMERFVGYYLLALLLVKPALAEDWPEWRGRGRLGVWTEGENAWRAYRSQPWPGTCTSGTTKAEACNLLPTESGWNVGVHDVGTTRRT